MRGILTGIGDFSRGGIVRGLGLTVTGTPDDEVHTAAGFILEGGKLYGVITTDHTLNQNDVAAAALTAGQSYWAVRTFVAGVLTMVKGAKATTPVKHTPAGMILPHVKVLYDAGGSEIEAADLEGTMLYDRFLAVAGSGLNLEIHPGFAAAGGTYRYQGSIQTLPLTDASTNRVWQLASGLWQDTTTEVPPEDTAMGPVWEVVTAGGVITTITDRRTYAGQTIVLHLRDVTPASVGEIRSLLVEHERLVLEQAIYRISDNGGTSGQSKFDLKVNTATIYTSFATEDHRPAFAHDAATLTNTTSVHEVTALKAGDVVSFESLEYPTGGSGRPVWAECYLRCRVP